MANTIGKLTTKRKSKKKKKKERKRARGDHRTALRRNHEKRDAQATRSVESITTWSDGILRCDRRAWGASAGDGHFNAARSCRGVSLAFSPVCVFISVFYNYFPCTSLPASVIWDTRFF